MKKCKVYVLESFSEGGKIYKKNVYYYLTKTKAEKLAAAGKVRVHKLNIFKKKLTYDLPI